MHEVKLNIFKGARKTTETEIMALLEWAVDYEKHNRWPRTPIERFAVAFYQTSQAERHLRAFRVSGAESALHQAWEAFTACSLHLMMTGERMKVPVNLDRVGVRCHDVHELLYRWGRAQQIVFYWWAVNKDTTKHYDRKGRIDLDQLSQDLWYLIHHYRACVPAAHLQECIHQATDIMCGKL